MNELIQIIGFACLGHLVTDLVATAKQNLPEKPFQCDMCMTYWISIVPFFLQFGISAFLYSAMAAILSKIIFKYTV